MTPKNTNAQEWLNEKYPINKACKRSSDKENKNKFRKDIYKLDIQLSNVDSGKKLLFGDLKLTGFSNLKELNLADHNLNSLDNSNCLNLEKIDISHNQNITSLNLSHNPNLIEVNFQGCDSLKIENIDLNNTNLIYDQNEKKLTLNNQDNSHLAQISSANKDSIRNILIIGLTGNGKSNLANTLTETNEFKSGSGGVSLTEEFKKSDIFEHNGNKYCVIDNIGFGDTRNISKEDFLFRIGQGIYASREGINQILFVVKGRFSEQQIIAFDMFKDLINQIEITKFTTITRTNFKDFMSKIECKKDHENLTNQSLRIKDLIESCSSIIHIDNPSIPVINENDDEDEKAIKQLEINRDLKKRERSREIILSHLSQNCNQIYKLKGWDDITENVRRVNQSEIQLSKTSDPVKREEISNEIRNRKRRIAERVDLEINGEFSASGPKFGFKIALQNLFTKKFDDKIEKYSESILNKSNNE